MIAASILGAPAHAIEPPAEATGGFRQDALRRVEDLGRSEEAGPKADSHAQQLLYRWRTCVQCHPREALDIHTTRTETGCRGCHGPDPIPSTHHDDSPTHLARRHADVCEDCHEGAHPSFATYVVHDPNPAALSTRESFPALFYAFWSMIALAVASLGVFLPHTVLWAVRERLPVGRGGRRVED